MRSLRPCSDSSATPSFPSQPEGKIGLPRVPLRGEGSCGGVGADEEEADEEEEDEEDDEGGG